MMKIEILWAVVYFICSVLWIYFEKSMGWHGPELDKHAAFSNLFAVPAIFIYWSALRHKRAKFFKGAVTWKELFLTGMRLTLLIMVLMPFVQILFHKYFSPDYFSNMIEFSVNIENRDRAKMEHFFTLSNFIFLAMKDALIWGTVMSVLLATVMRKKQREKKS